MKKIITLLTSMVFLLSSCGGVAAEALQYEFDTTETRLVENREDVHIKLTKEDDPSWYSRWRAVDHTSIVIYILTPRDDEVNLNLSNSITQAEFSIDGKTEDSNDYFANVSKVANYSGDLYTIIECDFHLLVAIQSLEYVTLTGKFAIAITLRKGYDVLNVHRELDRVFTFDPETSSITAI